MMLRMLGLIALVAMLAGCSALDDYGSDDDHDDDRQEQSAALPREDVVGIEWTATWMWGAEIVEEAPPTLLLQTDNRLAGFAGVNQFGGRYTLNAERGRVKFDQFNSTLMAGPDDRMEQESAYMGLLERVKAARVNRHGELELMEKGDVLVRYERSSDAIRHGLVGREWTLFRLRGERLVNGHEGSIEFKKDGSFAGFAGVNRYFGKYTKDDRTGRIELRDIGSTKMGGDERIMRQEERFLASLRAVDHFSFTDEGDLMLRNGDKVAVRFRKKQ